MLFENYQISCLRSISIHKAVPPLSVKAKFANISPQY